MMGVPPAPPLMAIAAQDIVRTATYVEDIVVKLVMVIGMLAAYAAAVASMNIKNRRTRLLVLVIGLGIGIVAFVLYVTVCMVLTFYGCHFR